MQEMALYCNFYDASQGKFMMKSFYALLEQELLLVEGEGRYILAESVRDKISEQGAKTGGNAGDNQDLPTKHQPSTNQAPCKHHASHPSTT